MCAVSPNKQVIFQRERKQIDDFFSNPNFCFFVKYNAVNIVNNIDWWNEKLILMTYANIAWLKCVYPLLTYWFYILVAHEHYYRTDANFYHLNTPKN